MVMHIDPKPEEYDTIVEIVRLDKDVNNAESIRTVVYSEIFDPPENHHRLTAKSKVIVDWEYPERHHVIDVHTSTGLEVSFTLAAEKQTPLSQYSVAIASLIMVFSICVYPFGMHPSNPCCYIWVYGFSFFLFPHAWW